MADEDIRDAGALMRWVEGPDGRTLDARVDVLGRIVVLHSRGGATGGRPPRNTQYELALHEICRRGQASKVFERILIDSGPARQLPVEQRILLGESEIEGLSTADLVSIIRSRLRTFGQSQGATGGNSTKRVRFDLKYGKTSQILRLRVHPPTELVGQRLASEQLRKVTFEHIRGAVARLLAGEAGSNFAESRDYDLVADDGTRLPPKRVFGLALEAALGIAAFPHHFSAGWGTPCFELLEAAGYPIVPKGGDDPREIEAILGDIHDEEARSFAEGSKSRAMHLKRERNQALVAAFKSAFLKRHARFFCQKCGEDWINQYGAVVASACFEAHHARIQISEMAESHQSTIDDLEMLCANCHRAEHRRMKLELS